MSSTNGKMDVDTSPNRKSSRNHSTDTHRTRRSHRSHSRDRRERHRERDRDTDERRRRSRDRGSERDYKDRERRSQSREKSHRDRDRDRDRHHRGGRRDEEGRYYSREDRERRRKREDGDESPERDLERSKRKRHEENDDPHAPPSVVKDSPRSRIADRRDRSRERRYDRRVRDPRDEDRDRRDSRRLPSDDGTLEDEFDKRSLRPSPTRQRPSPTYEAPPKEDDSEARSVFVSQLAARLTARDLGYFFEDKLGEGTVVDARIVTDRISRRSKGIGYVEFRSVDLVEKAMALSGTIVMGLPIMVQLTEAERNRLHPGDGNLNLPPGVNTSHGAMQLYVGSLHFNLTESDIRQVFEPFGELAFVDLHRDPMTGRSKGYAFIQYKRGEDAKMALEQMEGFELAGRTLRVNTVHEKGSVRYTQQDSLDEAGGGNLNAASRQALMQKLARIEPSQKLPTVNKPSIPQTMQSRSVLMKNMFNPEEETERDWDKELADEVKGECEEKYGKVEIIKVEKDSQGEIYVKFGSVEAAKKAIQGLNGRWFGGRQISAAFISDAIMMAHQ
ncbi:hypothetical protein EDD17DRAFT_1580250 [Pisolithus thermaeus]|nr:hypothetical protein EDD17DRAFT_1580250 [Pisolithus thermaeus]